MNTKLIEITTCSRCPKNYWNCLYGKEPDDVSPWCSLSDKKLDGNKMFKKIPEWCLLPEFKDESDKWISVDKELPLPDKFNDSDCVLCIDQMDFIPIVAWYNYKSKGWYVRHYNYNNNSITITHWQPLPPKPTK